ncbi:hypothetical protein C2E31_13475 [Rhodopirellula baltica]|nr:hypothetical protein C2E31_13475 [Rhodopirellula baltica]
MAQFHCSGWWEQDGYGRQPMSDFQLSFTNGRIFGSGTDMVGDFEMEGVLEEGKIYLRKQYIGKHEIEYHGISVGEGGYTGIWSGLGYPGGKWFIGVIRSASASDVQEIGSD